MAQADKKKGLKKLKAIKVDDDDSDEFEEDEDDEEPELNVNWDRGEAEQYYSEMRKELPEDLFFAAFSQLDQVMSSIK